MILELLAGAALSLPATGTASLDNVGMREIVRLADDLTMVSYSIIRDTRCPDPVLCFQDEELIVLVVVDWKGRWKEYRVRMGQPVRVADGWLTLLGTSAKPQYSGALPLKEYRLSYAFER